MSAGEWGTGTSAVLATPGLFHTPIHGPLSLGEVCEHGGVPVVPLVLGLDPCGHPVEILAPLAWLRALEAVVPPADARLAMWAQDHRGGAA